MPHLVAPTASVRDSYLEGERAIFAEEGLRASTLNVAEADFESFVNGRRSVREQWGVPITELWFVDGTEYIGTTIIRHRLTAELRESGGHIGFHVVPTQRRQGHATQMLRAAIARCRDLGLIQVLITCDVANAASRRVIEANGGRLERIKDGTCSYSVVPEIAPPDAAGDLAH